MFGKPRVTMTMRELDRLKCVQGVVDRQLKLYQAAERLGLTTRQVRRLVRRYRQEGPVGLISRHRNRPSNNRLKDAVADQAFRTLHYERKLYLLLDTPTNRRYCGKHVDVLQYPDGRIEIQVAGVSLPYSTYNKLGTIDQGTVVENKRLGHVLRIAQVVQAERDNRAVSVPSTAHRTTGIVSVRSGQVDG